jgi:hypothetical protein
MSDVDLKEYVDKLRAADLDAVKAALTSADKRLEGMNEFRKTLSDQAAKFIIRDEYYAAHQALIDKIDGVIVRIAAQEGSNKGSELTKANIIAYFGVAVAIITVIVIWANHR